MSIPLGRKLFGMKGNKWRRLGGERKPWQPYNRVICFTGHTKQILVWENVDICVFGTGHHTALLNLINIYYQNITEYYRILQDITENITVLTNNAPWLLMASILLDLHCLGPLPKAPGVPVCYSLHLAFAKCRPKASCQAENVNLFINSVRWAWHSGLTFVPLAWHIPGRPVSQA